MTDDLKHEMESAPYEPLLPIEKKLVAWSLAIGIALLVALALFNHFHPAAS